MRQLTILTGPRACEKTTKALEMVKDKKSLQLAGYNLDSVWRFSEVTEETEFLVFDGCTKEEVTIILVLFNFGWIHINKMNIEPKRIKIPNVIIITNQE